MTLAQLVVDFNHQFQQATWASLQNPFALEENTVVARFYGMRLESRFENLRNPLGEPFGQQALLQVTSPRGKPISPHGPYAVALDEDSIIALDRLIRTLHVLNAATWHWGGVLFLEVHPWHIAKVSDDHGAVFERILQACGRSPQDIVLEIGEAVAQDSDHLARAIKSFQARGFGIALHQRSADLKDLKRWLRLKPDFVKLNRSHWQVAEESAGGGRDLSQHIRQIQAGGTRVLLHGVTTEHQAQIARWAGADGYQDSIPQPIEPTTVIIVPGLGDSGPEHWQTLWERTHPSYRRVRQRDWNHPNAREWVDTLDREIRRAPSPALLVGHSLGCATIVEWAQRYWDDVRGALLVAPADTDHHSFFNAVPLQPLPFPSILVASENDPYLELERARWFARHWGSHLVNLGPAGHINVESGFGPWAAGEKLLEELRASAVASVPGALPSPRLALESAAPCS